MTEGMFSMEHNRQTYPTHNARYGADETRDVVIAADIVGDTVMVLPTAARYGDRWYLVSVNSFTQMILGLETTGAALYVLDDEEKALVRNLAPAATVAELPAAPARGFRYEGPGFDAPEDAVACYLEGLQEGDVQGMLQAFAWETQAARYSLRDYIRWMKALYDVSPVKLPALNAFVTEMNLGSLRSLQGKRIYAAIRNELLKDNEQYKELLDGFVVSLAGEEEVDAYIRAFEHDLAERLKGLRDIRLVDPVSVVPGYNNEKITETLETYRRIYGADEMKETLAVAGLDGGTLICDPLLARYGDKWYMVSVDGMAFPMLGFNASQHAFVTVDRSLEEELARLQE